MTHGNIVVKAAEDLERAMGGMANPKNNANIADLQRLAEITKYMAECNKSRAVDEAPVPEREEHKQLQDNTQRQTRSMSASQIAAPRKTLTPRIASDEARPRVQPRTLIPAQNVHEPPPLRVDETPILRVRAAPALRVRGTSKTKESQQKKAPAIAKPIASRTRS